MKKSIQQKIENNIRKKLKEYLDEDTKELIRAYKSEKDEVKKVELGYALSEVLAPVILPIYFEQLATMSDRDFSSYCRELRKPVLEKAEEVGEEYLKYDMIMRNPLVVLTEIVALEKCSKRLGKKIEKRIEHHFKDSKLIERLLVLISINYFAYRIAFVRFRPFFDVLNTARNKLGVDETWLIASAALDLEENMLKKKLIELGMCVDEIDNLEYYDMVDKVIKLIKKKEGRQIGLDLLLTSGYRKVRNMFEHRGYEYRPKNEEILNIIAHVIKLGKFLWPKISHGK